MREGYHHRETAQTGGELACSSPALGEAAFTECIPINTSTGEENSCDCGDLHAEINF